MENFDPDVDKLIYNYFNHGKQQTDERVHRQQVLVQGGRSQKVTGYDAFSKSLIAGEKDGD